MTRLRAWFLTTDLFRLGLDASGWILVAALGLGMIPIGLLANAGMLDRFWFTGLWLLASISLLEAGALAMVVCLGGIAVQAMLAQTGAGDDADE